MANRLETRVLWPAGTPLAGGGAQQFSGILDLRRFARVEAVWFRATSATGVPDVSLRWQGTILEGAAVNDDFQPFADNENLITGGPADQMWHPYEMPSLLAPFVRFQALGGGANPADTIITGYAYVRENFE